MDFSNPLVLERECPGGFPAAVAAGLREQIALERGAQGSRSAAEGRHLETLAQLAGYVAGLGPGDQRMRALALVQGFNTFQLTYSPGRHQRLFLARVGLDKRPPDGVDAMLSEWVAAAVEDVVEAAGVERGGLGERLRVAEERARRLEPFVARAEEAFARFNEARRELEGVRAELERTRKQRDHYRLFVPDGGERAAAPVEEEEKPSKPRRVRVEGEPYLYSHENAGGQAVYEVYHKDVGFRTIGADRAEAIKVRDELHGKGAAA